MRVLVCETSKQRSIELCVSQMKARTDNTTIAALLCFRALPTDTGWQEARAAQRCQWPRLKSAPSSKSNNCTLSEARECRDVTYVKVSLPLLILLLLTIKCMARHNADDTTVSAAWYPGTRSSGFGKPMLKNSTRDKSSPPGRMTI